MKQLKITRKEAELINKGIPSCKQERNKDFAWGAIKNERKINEINEDTNKLIEVSDSFKEYLKKRQELVTEYKEKGKDGKPLYQFIDGFKDYKMKAGFAAKAKKLEKQYKEAINDYIEQQKGLNDLASNLIEYEPYSPSKVPEKLTFLQFFSASYWIENLEYGKKSVTYDKGDLLGIELLHSALTKSNFAKDDTGKWIQVNFDVTNEQVERGLAKRENVVLDNQDFIQKMSANLRALIQAKHEVMQEKPYRDFFDIYNKEREDVIFKHVYITTGGEIATKNGQYVFQNREAFEKDIEAVRKKHKSILDAYDAWMDEKHEVKNVHTFKISDIPEMDGYLLGAIEKFIED